LIETTVKAGWLVISGLFKLAWDLISTTVRAAWSVISGIVKAGLDVIMGILRAAWDIVLGIVRAAWAMITATVNTALDLLKGILQFFADLVTGKWGKLWGDVKSTASAVWQDIYSFFKSILGDIEKTVVGSVSSIFGGFEKAIKDALSGVTSAFATIYNGIIGFFKDAGSWLYDIGKTILTGLLNGAKSGWNDVAGFFSGLGSKIIHLKGPPEYDKVMLTPNGQLIMQGLMKGIQAEAPALHAKLGSITASIKADMTGPQSLPQAFAAGLGTAASPSGTGGGNVYVTVEGGNTLMSDSDQMKFANLIGSKVVTHVAPQGGVKTLLR
jgi:phage-related protein